MFPNFVTAATGASWAPPMPSFEGGASSNPRASGLVPLQARQSYPKEWLNRSGRDIVIADGIRTFLVKDGGSIMQRAQGNLYPGVACSQLAGPAVRPANIEPASQYQPGAQAPIVQPPVARPATPGPTAQPKPSRPVAGPKRPATDAGKGISPLVLVALALALL